jgi:DNA-binding NarL/FixJ family response regulator
MFQNFVTFLRSAARGKTTGGSFCGQSRISSPLVGFVEAIKKAAHPKRPVSRTLKLNLSERCVTHKRSTGVRPLQFTLTPEQISILQLLADGWRYRDIGIASKTTEQTIKNRVRAMLQQAGADNSRHLIAQMFRSGALK